MAAERYIKAIIYVTILVWTIVLYVNHEAITSARLQHLSTVITIVLYAVMAFDLWLWKISLLHGWFVKRPVINGTWKVEIRSNWKDPETGAGIPPVEGFMVVRLQVRGRSPIHYGAVWLRIIDEPTKKIIGHYWTDRESTGEMELSNQQNKKFQAFQSALAYYGALHRV